MSPKTVAALARAVATLGHSDISILALQFGVEAALGAGNRETRAYNLVVAVRDNFGDASIRDVAEARLRMYYKGEPDEMGVQLTNALQLDGYEWTGGKLIPTTPGHIALGPLVSALEVKLQDKGLGIAANHYSQALTNFVDNQFESSNGQLRSFLEALLVGVAQNKGHKPDNTGAAIQVLHGAGEIDHAERAFIKGFWDGIQDKGPHFGLSPMPEAKFRFHTATALAAYLLEK